MAPSILLDGNGDLQYDASGNVVVNAAIAAPGRIDTLHGSARADTIRALAGNDVIEAAGGNDLAEGGSGSDIVAGQDGTDTLWGDTALTGSNPLPTALANGDTDTSQTAKGDWIDGGGDDDILIGTAAQDLLSGGSGNDLLVGSVARDALLVCDGAHTLWRSRIVQESRHWRYGDSMATAANENRSRTAA